MKRTSLVIAIILLAAFTFCAAAQEADVEQPAAAKPAEQSDRVMIETVDVPLEFTGSFNWETGEFTADVSEYEGAYIQITFKDVVVIGQAVVHRQKENYLLVTGNVRVEQKDFVLICDQVEYYTELEKLIGTGNVKVKTDDINASSDEMIYLQKEEQVDFIGNVAAETKDATIYGEHLIVLRPTNSIRFNGWFRVETKESEPAAQTGE